LRVRPESAARVFASASSASSILMVVLTHQTIWYVHQDVKGSDAMCPARASPAALGEFGRPARRVRPRRLGQWALPSLRRATHLPRIADRPGFGRPRAREWRRACRPSAVRP
jgi:hypothetical protein